MHNILQIGALAPEQAMLVTNATGYAIIFYFRK